MAQTVWQVLNSVADGGVLWLSIVFLLAVLGEMGLPFTCIVIESLFIFTGFELIHGAALTASLPLLGTAFAGRLLGATFLHRASRDVGVSIIGRFGPRVGITPESVAMLKERLSRILVPTVIVARFLPWFPALTSCVCGAMRVRRRKFVTAIIAHIVIWEAAFIAAGAIGALASRSLDPSTYPVTLAIVIAIVLSIATTVGYIMLHRLRNSQDRGDAGPKTTTIPDSSKEGRRTISAATQRASPPRQTGLP